MMLEKLEKFQILALSFIIAAGVVIAANSVTSAITKDTVTVTGSYSQTVTSDSARLEFELNAREATKSKSYEVLNKQVPVVLKYLEDKGFTKDEIDVKTPNGYNSYKSYPNGNSSNEIAYYNLSRRFEIKSKDVDKIKNIADDIPNLIAQGLDIDVYNPNYYYSKLSDIKVKMLEEATKDAKNRASAMLKATHNRVGKIQSVKMGVFQITPVDSNDVSDMGISDITSIEKKITSVANVTFSVK